MHVVGQLSGHLPPPPSSAAASSENKLRVKTSGNSHYEWYEDWGQVNPRLKTVDSALVRLSLMGCMPGRCSLCD